MSVLFTSSTIEIINKLLEHRLGIKGKALSEEERIYIERWRVLLEQERSKKPPVGSTWLYQLSPYQLPSTPLPLSELE